MKFDTYGNGNGLDDLYVLPENEAEREAITKFLKANWLPYSTTVADKESDWGNQMFFEIPFAECIKDKISALVQCEEVQEMRFNRAESIAIYRAAYRAMTEHHADMDVIWSNEGARPIASGAALDHHVVIMQNVQASDFGQDFDPETCTEDEFVDMCMNCWGPVEATRD